MREPERSFPEKKRKIEKMNAVLESELTETASEGEGEYDETCIGRTPFPVLLSQSLGYLKLVGTDCP